AARRQGSRRPVDDAGTPEPRRSASSRSRRTGPSDGSRPPRDLSQVLGSGFCVLGSWFWFLVHGSWFTVRTPLPQRRTPTRTPNPESRTPNQNPEPRTRTRNQEPRTKNPGRDKNLDKMKRCTPWRVAFPTLI